MGKVYIDNLWENAISRLSKAAFRTGVLIIFLSIIGSQVNAQVVITAPSLNVTTCGNFPTDYFPLGNIVIQEKSDGDFSGVSNGKIILSAPADFEFQPGNGNASGTGQNISSVSMIVTSTSITITYSIGGTNKNDNITITGLKVRGINGAASGEKLTRTGTTPLINGDIDGTVHATFSSQILPTPTLITSTNQSSCTGSSANIALSSSPSGAAFSWVTGNINNVTGAASGSGNTISQNLSSVGAPGTVDYIVTSTLNGCAGTPPTITNTVNPKATVNAVTSQIVCMVRLLRQ